MSKPQPRSNYPFLFLPDGWDSGWRAAKAGAGGSPARLMLHGDSIPAGSNVSDVSKRFPDLLSATLSARLGGRYAEFFSAIGDSNVYTSPITGTPFLPQNATTWGSANWFAWFTGLYTGSTTAQSGLKFTSPWPCTQMDICYVDSYPGSWKYAVDGGAQVTVTNASASSTAANTSVKKISVTGLSNTTHTIDFGWQSANATCMLQGVSCYTGNAGGFSLARFYSNGEQITNYAQSGAMPADRFALFSNKSPQNDATAAGAGAFGYPLVADLYVCQLIVNTVNSGNPHDDLSTHGGKIVRAIQRANPGASLLFLIPSYPFTPYDDVNSGFASAQYYHQFTAELYDLARLYNAAVFNVHARWGSTPFGQGFMAANSIHPLDAGHADIAATLLGVL